MELKKVARGLMYASAMALMVTSFQNCGSEFAPGISSSGSNGGGGGGGITPAEFAALESQALALINSRCVSCHSGSVSSTAPDLSNKAEMLINGAIDKNAPQNSAVYLAMVDQSMPPGGGITSAQYNIVRDWIVFMP